jgi:hypothetical protein
MARSTVQLDFDKQAIATSSLKAREEESENMKTSESKPKKQNESRRSTKGDGDGAERIVKAAGMS